MSPAIFGRKPSFLEATSTIIFKFTIQTSCLSYENHKIITPQYDTPNVMVFQIQKLAQFN